MSFGACRWNGTTYHSSKSDEGEGELNVRADFRLQLFDRFFDMTHMRVDLQRPLVAFHRLSQVSLVGMTMTQARPRTEVDGHELYDALAVGNRGLESLEQVLCQRSLVVGFCKIRADLDGFVEVLDGVIVIPPVDRFCSAAKVMIGFIRSATKPDRPYRVFGHLIDHRIGVFQLVRQRGQARITPDERQR